MTATRTRKHAKTAPVPAVAPEPVPYLGLFNVRCGYCLTVHAGDPGRSFAGLYDGMRDLGWQEDLFGTWTCPPCQARAEWMAPFLPAVRLHRRMPEPAPLITTGALPELRGPFQRAQAAHRLDSLADTTALDLDAIDEERMERLEAAWDEDEESEAAKQDRIAFTTGGDL